MQCKPFKILVIGACLWFEIGVHFLIFLWLVPIFEWYVIRCGSHINTKQTCAQDLMTITTLKAEGGQYDYIRRKNACTHLKDD